MKITSPAFSANQEIPEKYSCKGKGVNPGLKVEGIPSGTRSLALIVDDPDAPRGTFVHWVVYNIPPSTADIRENSVPGIEGKNSAQETGYTGPCPPSGTHRYFFKVYALDTTLSLSQDSGKKEVEQAMQGHVLGSAQVAGKSSRR